MQDHPGAPGTARQESTRTIVSTYDGGTATQPRAPGHERPHAALCAARHGRLSAASTAPGADIPLATAAGAPGQYCLSAAPRAPGHGRPLAITAGVSGHDRLSAALRAPGVDAAPAIAATRANSSPSECRTHRHRTLAGRTAPAAPGNLAPHSCHSQHPDLPALPLHRFVIAACAASHPLPRSKLQGRAGEGATTRPPHHQPSASCHPGPAPAAVLLHRGHGRPPPAPLPRPAARGHLPSPGACSGGGLGRGDTNR